MGFRQRMPGASVSAGQNQPNMPAWGGENQRIGNNPLVFAIPRSNGQHVVIDCAMSSSPVER